jgi:hypothetical protein
MMLKLWKENEGGKFRRHVWWLKYATFFFWPVGQKGIGRRCGKNLKRHEGDFRNGY